ncbi:ER membrane protein complex subunit 1 [Nymphon striatum]|nr:ER membrane protein complex subunit 1 [Nymphon striatum]
MNEISHISALVFTLLSILCLVQYCGALYEDQIGKFDWKQEYVGFVDNFLFDVKSSGRKVIVATEQNVLAALDPRDGTISWRQVFESGENGNIDNIYQNKGVITTLTGGAKFVRTWDSNSGLLINEHAIPFLAKPDLDTSFYGFNVDEQIVYKGTMQFPSETNKRPLIVINAHYINRDNDHLEKQEISAPWLNVFSKCIITWDSLLVCVDISKNAMYSCNLKNMQTINDDNIESATKVNFNSHKMELDDKNVNQFEISQPIANHILVKLNHKKIQLLYQVKKKSQADIDILLVKRFSNVVDSGVVETNNNLAYYSLTKTPNQNIYEVSVNVDSQMKETAGRHFSLPVDTGNIVKTGLHIFSKKDGSIGYRLLLSTSDHSIIMVNYSGKLMWKRDESLASILNVEMLELPVSDTEARFEEEFGVKDGNIVSMFLHRITSQIHQLQSFINDLFTDIIVLISTSPPDVASATQMMNSGNQQKQLVRDEFNLHKIIVVTTSSGKLFGIDNVSGAILWTKFIEELECIRSSLNNTTKLKLPLFVQRTTAHFPHRPQCAVLGVHKITGNSIVYVFDPITGDPVEDKSKTFSSTGKTGLHLFSFRVMQVSLIHYHNDQFIKPLLMLDTNEKAHVFPDSHTSTVIEKCSSLYMFSANATTGFIYGYGFHHSTQSEIIATKLWTIAFPTKLQKITHVVTKRSIERVHSQGRVMGDRSVLYKYLNPNLAVVITEGIDISSKPYISLYLIDGVTGNIIHSVIHRRVHGPVHVVHSENWIVSTRTTKKVIREMNMAEKSIEIARDRGLATEDLLKYDVLPSPMLFDDHGLMTKPEKSQLIRELEDKLVSDDYSYHHKPESAFIIDVMATSASHQNLPPTSQGLKPHIYRAFYNAYITMHVLDRQLNVKTEDLNPVDYGFRLEDGQLLPSTSWKTLEARWVVYSYFNEKSRRTDVAVLELFEGKTQSNTTVFSSLHPPLLNIVEKQAYIFPMSGIVAMADTITDKGMTSKHVLVALPTGAILEIPKFFLDPRRPIVMTQELREEGLMPYIPELPIPTEHIINYNKSVVRVRDIYTAPAGLESTSLVFVYGLGKIFSSALTCFIRELTPSKTFDVLKDDFDHYFIALVLLALIAASYLTKRLAAHKALKQAWK